MDSEIAIRATGLGKKYIIGHQQVERIPTLRDTVMRTVGNFARMGQDMLRRRPMIAGDEIEEFWALRDIDFEIRRGEVVGIIGRNGAGKSTLLKVLSRITEPTEGRVEINGRASSLLEVGTGFHPELSGRENIFLNGAILGMSHAEIRRKFDEIVAFSEVERFLDTPVKRYSSGMYVRLAFAVAAHLEPEILIVDEVLAVGDAEFQRKCLGKMHDVAGEGRTVLFVSHNLSTITTLCPRGILLDKGVVRSDGKMDSVIGLYSAMQRQRIPDIVVGGSRDSFSIDSISSMQVSEGTKQIAIEIDANIFAPAAFEGAFNLYLKDEVTSPVGAASLGGMGAWQKMSLAQGSNPIGLKLTLPRMAEGSYFIDLELSDPNKKRVALFDSCVEITVVPEIENGCAEVLRQSWGFGPVWFEAKLK